MMVVPNEFGGLSVRSSKCVTADARDLGGEMQSCSHAACLVGCREEACKVRGGKIN